jgi:hypothetical protein
VVEWTCWNSLSRRVVTLFANGTVRRKESAGGESTLWLGELDPPRLEAFERRLAEPDTSETDRGAALAPEGPWIEQCEIDLRLPLRRGWKFAYGRFDTLPLSVSQMVRVLEDVAAVAEQRVGLDRLPDGYQARVSDVLRRRDGMLFRVVAVSTDKLTVELSGTVAPLTLYLNAGDLARDFDALVSRLDPDLP